MKQAYQTPLNTAETRLRLLGFRFLDMGCFEHPNGMTLQLGGIPDGLTIRPLDPKTMEPTAPNYLCEDDREFEQALLLLGAIAA
jgi:hypothetical protein